jgi:Tfp pilus assembly protein PilN
MMRRIDLLPAVYEQRRRERRNLFIVVVATLVVLLLMFGWWFVLGFQVQDAEDKLAQAKIRNTRLSQEIQRLQQFATLENEVRAKRTALQTVFAGDLDWPALLTELAMVIPDDVWLLSFQASAGQTEGAAPVPTETNPIDIAAAEPFGRIQFEGNALSMRAVATWLLRLDTVDEFLAAYLGGAERPDEPEGDTGIPVVEFTNTIELSEKAVSQRFQDENP